MCPSEIYCGNLNRIELVQVWIQWEDSVIYPGTS
jgi:hypothetical protein